MLERITVFLTFSKRERREREGEGGRGQCIDFLFEWEKKISSVQRDFFTHGWG